MQSVYNIALQAYKAYNDVSIYDYKTDTECFLYHDESKKDLVIAFRGTEAGFYDKFSDTLTKAQKDELNRSRIQDLKTDIDFWPTHSPQLKCMVHDGFHDSAISVFNYIISYLQNHKTTITNIYVTGHSLGAAVATVTTALLVKKGIKVHGLVTLGSPRVGFSGLKKILKPVPKYRFVRKGDSIAKVPFFVPFMFPYCHICKQFDLPGHKNMIGDHEVSGYLNQIKNFGFENTYL